MVATCIYEPLGNGNRTEKDAPSGTTYYAWDPQDRLVAVYKPSGRTFTFVYNVAGQRITRQTYGGERNFVYDRNKPLLETDAGAQTTLTYDYSNRDEYGELLSRRHQGVTDFHQYDALGSTRHLLDEAQSPTDGYIYRAFGKVESKTGATENHQLYVGRFGYFAEEELGLYFLNARYYDLATHQFISRDPTDEDGNLYRYVRNKPLNVIDPSGLVGTKVSTTDVYVRINLFMQIARTFTRREPVHLLARPPEKQRTPEEIIKFGQQQPKEYRSDTRFVEFYNLGDLISKLNSTLEYVVQDPCGCIAVLEIFSHTIRTPDKIQLGASLDFRTPFVAVPRYLDVKAGSANSITANNAAYVGSRIRKETRLCSPCLIILNSCVSGVVRIPAIDIPKRLAKGSGCHVAAAGGFTRGVFLDRTVTVEDKEWKTLRERVTGEAKSWHKIIKKDPRLKGWETITKESERETWYLSSPY